MVSVPDENKRTCDVHAPAISFSASAARACRSGLSALAREMSTGTAPSLISRTRYEGTCETLTMARITSSCISSLECFKRLSSVGMAPASSTNSVM
eukprot:502631-Pyramimonas_sp.AAC.1